MPARACASRRPSRREALLELEGLYPVIHAKLIANVNLHLATRLMATTEIARGR